MTAASRRRPHNRANRIPAAPLAGRVSAARMAPCPPRRCAYVCHRLADVLSRDKGLGRDGTLGRLSVALALLASRLRLRAPLARLGCSYRLGCPIHHARHDRRMPARVANDVGRNCDKQQRGGDEYHWQRAERAWFFVGRGSPAPGCFRFRGAPLFRCAGCAATLSTTCRRRRLRRRLSGRRRQQADGDDRRRQQAGKQPQRATDPRNHHSASIGEACSTCKHASPGSQEMASACAAQRTA